MGCSWRTSSTCWSRKSRVLTPDGNNAGGGVPTAGGSGQLRVKIQGGPDRQPASEPDMRVVLYDEQGGAQGKDVNNLIQVFEIDFPNEFTIPMPRYDNRDTWNKLSPRPGVTPKDLLALVL